MNEKKFVVKNSFIKISVVDVIFVVTTKRFWKLFVEWEKGQILCLSSFLSFTHNLSFVLFSSAGPYHSSSHQASTCVCLRVLVIFLLPKRNIVWRCCCCCLLIMEIKIEKDNKNVTGNCSVKKVNEWMMWGEEENLFTELILNMVLIDGSSTLMGSELRRNSFL